MFLNANSGQSNHGLEGSMDIVAPSPDAEKSTSPTGRGFFQTIRLSVFPANPLQFTLTYSYVASHIGCSLYPETHGCRMWYSSV